MKKVFFRVTTVSSSLSILLKGQLQFLNRYYEVVGVASGSDCLKLLEEREGIRTFEVPMERKISLFHDVYSLFKFIQLFSREHPYIVHANTPKASLLSMIAAWIVRVPHRIYTVTGLRFETTTGWLHWLLIVMEKITCRCATMVIPEGKGVKNTLLVYRITNKPLKVILNGNINGVDTEYFSLSQEVIEKSNSIRKDSFFTFIFVGRMVKDKGVNELVYNFVKLYAKYANIRLFLVGDFERELDPLNEDVENLIEAYKSILVVGYQSDVRPYFAASDALIFPSYREGFPNVVLQAGAMELPSIVTDINGCNEIIYDGVNGKIIPARDEEALYNAMEWFYIHRNKEVKEMAKKARPMIVERYEQCEVWGALLKEYQSLE